MKSTGLARVLMPLLLVQLLSGCLGWDPGWKAIHDQAAKGNVYALLGKARMLEGHANTREKVQKLIAAYEEAYRADPSSYEALSNLGSYYFLMGQGYSDDVKEKKNNYEKALQYCEKAMYLDAGFKSLIDTGQKTWEACSALKKDRLMAMYFWYLSLGGYWNECLCMPGKLLNFSWVGRNKKMLDRMFAIDPLWGNGRVQLSLATYYALVPGAFGGDMKKSGDYFTKALELGPHMVNFHVSRAQFYQKKMKDKQGFVTDLHHAIAIDPHNADTLSYPWASMYQARAKQLLGETDKYFK